MVPALHFYGCAWSNRHVERDPFDASTSTCLSGTALSPFAHKKCARATRRLSPWLLSKRFRHFDAASNLQPDFR